MDAKLMYYWLEVIWNCILEHCKKPMLTGPRQLPWQSWKFCEKQLNTLKQFINGIKHAAIILEHRTSIQQSLDANVNNLLKDYIRKLSTECMADSECSFKDMKKSRTIDWNTLLLDCQCLGSYFIWNCRRNLRILISPVQWMDQMIIWQQWHCWW